ncbi:hypothetical protein Dsin_015305 [Dipteronia sinensis]|uniref:NAC domain-containing protein n=1 Tax=Dipteronia sinensis TaxID=43782 RepID=A0AAE0ABA3_9ROSI|nr:hypothetical protein Dsin_015305 [Dipteronia sinensis]
MKNISRFPNAGLPFGYRFFPTGEELILDYLFPKVHGNPLPCPTAVIDCDIYGGDIRAWKCLFEESEEEEEEDTLYFFAKLKKKKKKSEKRVTSYGAWRSRGSEKKIYLDGNERLHVGSHRRFSLKPKTGVEITGRWVMHEYQLDGCLPDQNDNKYTYVICKIKKYE